MATWRDGPAYAPASRPVAFAAPKIADLPAAEPTPPATAGAVDAAPDAFTAPDQNVPALEELVPVSAQTRDATKPFDVASLTLTKDSSAWGSAHSGPGSSPAGEPGSGFDPRQPITTSAPRAVTPGSFAPPPEGSAPMATFPAPTGPAPHGGPVYPNSNGYVQPNPAMAPAPRKVDAKVVWDAMTPGMAIGLLLGCFLPFLSLMTYLVAFAFSFRLRYAHKPILTTFVFILSVIALVGLIDMTTARSFSDWWMSIGGWALLGSWVTLLLSVIFIYREISGGGRARTPF